MPVPNSILGLTVGAGPLDITHGANWGAVLAKAVDDNFAALAGLGTSLLPTDTTAQLQAKMTAALVGQTPLLMGPGNYHLSATLTLDNTNHPGNAFTFSATGYSTNPVAGGAAFVYDPATGYAFEAPGLAGNQDSLYRLSGFAITYLGGANSPGPSGFHGNRLNNTLLDYVIVTNFGGNGFEFTNCYEMEMHGGGAFGCYGNGINVNGTGNNTTFNKVKAFGNGRNPTTIDQANMAIAGTTSQSPAVRNCDLSYAGRGLCVMTAQAGMATISSIVVVSSVATAHCPAHGLSTGYLLAVTFNSTANLQGSLFGKTITVVDANTFTFPTGASDGTYNIGTDPGLVIGTFSDGLFLGSTVGQVIDGHYCEAALGFSAYIAAAVKSVTFIGGFSLNCKILFDSPVNCSIEGHTFQGFSAGLVTSEAQRRPTIDVKFSTLSFLSGATWAHGDYYRMDGEMYGPAIPSDGTWLANDRLWNSAAASGQPMGWICTAAGTPGTWKSMGNLA